jgi:hypothetical protein
MQATAGGLAVLNSRVRRSPAAPDAERWTDEVVTAMRRYAFAAVLLLFGFATESHPCSCLQTSLPGRPGIAELSKYEVVLLGQVVNVQEVEEPWVNIEGEQVTQVIVNVTIRVRKAWKGPRVPLTYVRTQLAGGPCGYPFKLGETYLLYARGKTEPYSADQCDPTKLAERAGDEIAALNKLLVPTYGSPSN